MRSAPVGGGTGATLEAVSGPGEHSEYFLRELERLARTVHASVAWEKTADDRQHVLRPEGDEGFSVEVRLEDDDIEVRLGGWTRLFEVGGAGDEARDEADSALDLIAAALFGLVRLVVKTSRGKAHAWTLQLREPDGWNVISSAGAPSLNPFARRGVEHRVNAVPRPEAYPASPTIGLPWAPWAGAAGFSPLSEGSDEQGELPVDGVLDLHNFHPKEVKPLVLAYVQECKAAGISELRIIHGKGTGQLRRTVHALLDGHADVKGYRLGGHGGGSWGATIVDLRAPGESPDDGA